VLFQRIYNWCKYKTLPSSFLFKNRLFIERDSKHRRIMSNFGLSFRNSKWTNFETYNIKNNFRTSYFKYTFYIIFSIFFIFSFLNFKSYYISFYLFNNVAFFFWLSADTFDYYFSFLIWSVTLIFSLFFNLIYSYFFLNNFFNHYNKKNFLNTYSSNSNLKPIYISKHNLNSLLYSWLINPHSLKNDKILENIFENKINHKWWNENFDFFIKLYKTSYFLNLISSQNSFFNLINKINFLSNFGINNKFSNGGFFSFFNNNLFIKNYSNVLLSFFLMQHKNRFDLINDTHRSLIFLKKKHEWNLYNFHNEINSYDYLLKNKNGLFVLTNFNYEKLSFLSINFKELFLLSDFWKNQLNSSKWNRWLYRYSILHRKILKNSHKITLIKRLVNTGFYDSKLFNSNIWATGQLNKLNSNQTFKSFIDVFYGNLLTRNNFNTSLNHNLFINNNNYQVFSLNLLNFYENSYFWYLKRFYNFNTLSTNFIKSKVKIYSTSNNFDINENINNNLINQKDIFFTYILNSFYINNKSLNNSYENNYVYSNNNDSQINSFFKDTYLLVNNNNLFTKNNLNILFSLTSSLNNSINLNFYNYNNYSGSNFLMNSLDFLNNTKNTDLNYWIAYSLINNDEIYVNDIIYINLFF